MKHIIIKILFVFQKIKDYERDIVNYQSKVESKDTLFNKLQEKFDEQTTNLQLIVCPSSFLVFVQN
jgi:hypothetical protein